MARTGSSKLLVERNYRRGSAALAGILIFAAGSGCTSTATRYLGDSQNGVIGITEAIGSLHSEYAGIHVVGTFTLIRGEKPAPGGPATDVFSLQSDGWSIEFQAPYEIASDARNWILPRGAKLQANMARMVGLLRETFTDVRRRRFRVLVLPQGASFDRSWRHLAINDDDLLMQFAIPLPGMDSTMKSLDDLFPILAHEFSHSYFWFHKDRYRNNFSDEVVAYTVERCVAWQLSGHNPSALPPSPADLGEASAQMSAWDIYARFKTEYPDTLVASVVASLLLRRVQEDGGNSSKSALKSYCQTLPMAGTDFVHGPTRPGH